MTMKLWILKRRYCALLYLEPADEKQCMWATKWLLLHLYSPHPHTNLSLVYPTGKYPGSVVQPGQVDKSPSHHAQLSTKLSLFEGLNRRAFIRDSHLPPEQVHWFGKKLRDHTQRKEVTANSGCGGCLMIFIGKLQRLLLLSSVLTGLQWKGSFSKISIGFWKHKSSAG